MKYECDKINYIKKCNKAACFTIFVKKFQNVRCHKKVRKERSRYEKAHCRNGYVSDNFGFFFTQSRLYKANQFFYYYRHSKNNTKQYCNIKLGKKSLAWCSLN